MNVALATSASWPDLSPDDAALAPALAGLGVDARPAIWSDPSIDWRSFHAVVIRSCWDYHLRSEEFISWLDRLERENIRVFNPPSVLRWNMHKSYLLDLAAKGVRIPRTEIIRGRKQIVKPAISASAHATHVIEGDVIVQEFVEEIVRDGEWSVVFFDGVFSHAVRKRPRPGDFRVQEELGGSSDLATAPAHVIAEAKRILDFVSDDVLYARVDVVERPAGVTLMELELIEPMLFLAKHDDAALRFARAIAARL